MEAVHTGEEAQLARRWDSRCSAAALLLLSLNLVPAQHGRVSACLPTRRMFREIHLLISSTGGAKTHSTTTCSSTNQWKHQKQVAGSFRPCRHHRLPLLDFICWRLSAAVPRNVTSTAQPSLLAGTILTSAYQLFKEPVPDPQWAAVVPHFRHLTERERAAYDPEGAATHGWFYTTFIT